MHKKSQLIQELHQLEAQPGPYISIFQKLHTAIQDTDRDRLVFKNLVKEAKQLFEQMYPKKNWNAFQSHFDQLYSNNEFWQQSSSYIGLIVEENQIHIFPLTVEVEDQVLVSNVPYIMPLIENNQFSLAGYILCLNRDSFALYELIYPVVRQISLPEDAPVTLIKALGKELTGGELNHKAYGGGISGSTSYHGHNTKNEEEEIDRVNYFQAVDQYITKQLAFTGDYPLMLFALPENQALFAKISKNRQLRTEPSVNGSSSALSNQEIIAQIMELNQQWKEMEQKKFLQMYARSQIGKHIITNLEEIQTAAIEGRVATLLLVKQGLVDMLSETDNTQEQLQRVINNLVWQVIEKDGQVLFFEKDQMPHRGKLEASLRY